MEATRWRYSESGASYCETCKLVAKKTKKNLTCDQCDRRMPELHPEIIPVFNCFILCETQLMAGGMGGAYGINYLVVFEVARAMGIEVNLTFLKFLKIFEHTLITEMDKKVKKETAKVGEANASKSRQRR